MLPCSWMMQSMRLTPAAAMRSPAARPATWSGWPKWVVAPNSRPRSSPELIERTISPASTAARTEFSRASGVGERDDQDIVARGDGVIDQPHLCVDVAVAVVAEFDAELALGGLCAGGHLVPEGVADAAVRDHGDPQVDLGQGGGLALGADNLIDAAQVGREHGQRDDRQKGESAPMPGDADQHCARVHLRLPSQSRR